MICDACGLDAYMLEDDDGAPFNPAVWLCEGCDQPVPSADIAGGCTCEAVE